MLWILYAGLALLAVATFAAAAAVRRPALAILVTPADLVVTLRGLEPLVTGVRRVRVPLDDISWVGLSDRADIPDPDQRRRPRLIRRSGVAGVFGAGDTTSFWDVQRTDRLVHIECRANATHRRIVLELDAPEAQVERLRFLTGRRARRFTP